MFLFPFTTSSLASAMCMSPVDVSLLLSLYQVYAFSVFIPLFVFDIHLSFASWDTIKKKYFPIPPNAGSRSIKSVVIFHLGASISSIGQLTDVELLSNVHFIIAVSNLKQVIKTMKRQ